MCHSRYDATVHGRSYGQRNHADSVQQRQGTIGFSISRVSAGSENDQLHIPLANILAASPYIEVQAMHHVHNLDNLLPPPVSNILHLAQCDPGANIIATHYVDLLSDTVTLEHPFPISSSDRKNRPMAATIKGTFVLLLSDGTSCKI
jgi:hypothetical protein